MEKSLHAFTMAAWHIVEPRDKFVDNWHIQAICAHLEACTRHEILVFLETIPPRHAKSTIASVIWMPWAWTTDPGSKWMNLTYEESLTKRDAVRSRMIVESAWYQSMWPIKLVDDMNTKERFMNTEGGFRFSTTTGGTITGEGADYIVIDDPMNVKDSFSKAKLDEIKSLWEETLPTRVNDSGNSTFVVTAQRLAPNDLPGIIIRQKPPGFVHLNLPARFESGDRCETDYFRDPRTYDGEPLWIAKWPDAALKRLEATLSPYARAAQLQQKPQAAGGNMLLRQYWKVYTAKKPPKVEQVIISLDCASKVDVVNDFTACTVWGLFKPDEDAGYQVILIDAWNARLMFPQLKARVLETIEDHTYDGVPPDYVLIEDKSAGIGLIQELQAAIEGPMVTPYNPGRASKVERAYLVVDVLSEGNVWVFGRENGDGTRAPFPEAKAEMVIAQCEAFPAGEHDDLTDSSVQALAFYRDRRDLMVSTDEEVDEDEDERSGASLSLYREPLYG